MSTENQETEEKAKRSYTSRKKVTAEVTKFEQQLTRSNSQITADRARRIKEAVSDEQNKLVMDLKALIRKDENELDAMMDLSTSNENTSINVISPSFDAAQFVRRINDLKSRLAINEEKLAIAEDTLEEWF
jgi:DNA polymerase/3'-5' exonuclease PolX